MPAAKTVQPPEQGLWRVARGDPFALRDPSRPLTSHDDPGTGNRFDSALGDYRVWYFATTRKGCYGETLAPLRPDPAVVAAARDDDGLMPLGEIPADWRSRRIAVRAVFPEERPFLDVEAAGTRAVLTGELPWLLAMLGLQDIDVAAIRGSDRRLTRWISQWAWQRRLSPGFPDYAGVRFCSRLNSDWECWALFEDVVVEEKERRSVLRQDPELAAVADLYELEIF